MAVCRDERCACHNVRVAVEVSTGIPFGECILDSLCVGDLWQRGTCICVWCFCTNQYPPASLSFTESYHWPKENRTLSLPTWRGALASVTEFSAYSRACLVIPGIHTQITHDWVIAFLSLGRSPPEGPSQGDLRTFTWNRPSRENTQKTRASLGQEVILWVWGSWWVLWNTSVLCNHDPLGSG